MASLVAEFQFIDFMPAPTTGRHFTYPLSGSIPALSSADSRPEAGMWLPSGRIGRSADDSTSSSSRSPSVSSSFDDSSSEQLDRSQLTSFRSNEAVRGFLLEKLEELKSQTAVTAADSGASSFPDRASADHITAPSKFEHQTVLDQISDIPFSERRSRAITGISGGAGVASQFGMKVAKTQTPFSARKGLRLNHPKSSDYHRFKPTQEFRKQCESLYQAKRMQNGMEDKTARPEYVAFVHSVSGAAKMRDLLGKRLIKPGFSKDFEDFVVAPNLVAIPFAGKYTAQTASEYTQAAGPVPSIYEVWKMAQAEVASPPVLDPTLDNSETMDSILSWLHHGPLKDLAALPKQHPVKEMADTAVAMISGLKILLERKGDADTFKHDPVIANSLHMLAEVIPYLLELAKDKDEVQFVAAYQEAIEEIIVTLLRAKPYSEEDFKKNVVKNFGVRAGHPNVPEPKPFLFASGMDALTTSLKSVQDATGISGFQYLSDNDPESMPDYFEVNKILGEGTDEEDKLERIVLATLNPSTPKKQDASDSQNDWNVDKLVDSLKKRLDKMQSSEESPLILILDTTIEKAVGSDGKSDLSVFFDKMGTDINDKKRLIVLTAKSLEKFEGLHAARFSAAEGMLIGADSEITKAIEKQMDDTQADVNWIANDESQPMMHAQMHAYPHALKLADKAARNTAFIHRHVLGASGTHGFDWYEPGLPMGVVKNLEKVPEEDKRRIPGITPLYDDSDEEFEPRKVSFRLGESVLPERIVQTLQEANAQDFLHAELDVCPSFAFPETTFIGVGEGEEDIRIAAGQESHELLTEKLYAFGWILNRLHKYEERTAEIEPRRIVKEIESIIQKALAIVLEHQDVETWGAAALDILRNRPSSVENDSKTGYSLERLEEKWASFNGFLKASKKTSLRLKDDWSKEQKEELRRMLIEGLTLTRSAAGNALADDVKLFAAAKASAPPHSFFAEPDYENSEEVSACYALNRAASMLAFSGYGLALSEAFAEASDNPETPIRMDRETRQKLDAAFRAFLDAGLPGFTPLYRARVIERWLGFNRKMHEDAEQSAALANDIIKYAPLLPWHGEAAKTLFQFPEEAFEKLEPALAARLVNALFGPLDIVAQCAFVNKLAMDNQDEKARACLQDLYRKVDGLSSQQMESLVSHLLELADETPSSPITDKAALKAFMQKLLLDAEVRFEPAAEPWLRSPEYVFASRRALKMAQTI